MTKHSIYGLLDLSGSMQGRIAETVQAFNTFVREAGKSRVSLYGFNNNKQMRDRRQPDGLGVLLTELAPPKTKGGEKWPGLDEAVSCGGMTPLYDAMIDFREAIVPLEGDRHTVVFLTDGDENASTRHGRAEAADFVKSLRDRGANVVFIGADFDAFAQAASFGVKKDDVLNMAAGSYVAGASALASRTQNYAATGVARGFTDEERAAAAGKKA